MIYSGSYPFLINEVISTVSKIRDNSKVSKISFLISSNTMRRALKEYITDELGILYNSEFFTKIDLAKKLTGIEPIKDLQKNIILEKILKDKNLYVEGIEKEYSQLIQKLKENKIEKNSIKENKNLYSVFTEYEKLLSELDIKDREDIIIEASNEDFKTDFLFIFGFQTLTEIDRDLFSNLLEKNKAFIFIPVDFNSGVIKGNIQLEGIYTFFKGFRFKDKKEKPSTKNQKISQKLFSREILETGIHSQNLLFLKSKGKRKEIEKVAKFIRKITETEKKEWFKVGVIINNIEDYIEIIKDVFSKYRIPYYLSEENRYIDEIGFKKLYSLFLLKQNNFNKDLLLNSLSLDLEKLEDVNLQEVEKILDENAFEEGFEELIELIQYDSLIKLLQVINNFPENSNIVDFCKNYISFIDNYLIENEYSKKLKEILELIKSDPVLKELYTSINIEDFNNLILHFLEEENIQNRLKGNIVEVRTPSISAGLLFDYIFFIGMNEGDFPSPIKENPILDDVLREKLENIGFPKLDSSYWQQILVFLSVFNSSKNVYVSFRDKDEKGNDLSPSIVVEELLKYQFGKDYFNGKIEFTDEPENIFTYKEYLIENSKDLINYFEFLEKLVNAYTKRENENLSEFEGKLKIPIYEIKYLTPSKIQNYSNCPYKFFIENVLNIEVVKPPDKERISADKEGSVIHKILELTYKNHVIGKTVNYLNISNFIDKEFKKRFEPLIAELKPSSQIFEMKRIDSVRKNILRFINWDLNRLKENKFQPEMLETKKSIKVKDFIISGKIDRADKDENGYYYVYDYKTGKQKVDNLEETLKKGNFLQLYLYKNFLETEDKEVKKIGLFFVKEAEGQIEKSTEVYEELEEKLSKNLNTFLSLMEDGYFTPFYNSEMCNYCDFIDFCERTTNEYLEEKSKKDDYYLKYIKIKDGKAD